MARTRRVQVFIVSWFPIYATEAATIQCISRASAEGIDAARCDRQLGARFGDEAYAAEELIAELGAAFLCADLGISDSPRDDHASYIAGWIRVLKNDNRAVFRAASLAEKAAAFLHAAQPAAAEPVAELALAA
jgi:antirestriction protein ArdC